MQSTMENSEGAPKRRTLAGYAGIGARGFAMGSADVVPGVSGGTMALILGIYEELINSIRMVGQPEFWRALVRFRIGRVLELLNWKFLLAVFIGIFTAILTLAPIIEYLLTNQPVLIWSFFFGLVTASVIVVAGRIKQWSPVIGLALVAGAIFAFWIVGLVPAQTPDTWWFLIFAGALASSAMILPGISGSFILVLLGKYEFVISAVNNRDIVTIGLIGIGAVIGLVTLAQLLSWLFKHHHDLTIAVLIGFMIGSLRKIWPWKEVLSTTIDRHGEEVPALMKNVLPPMTINGAFNTEIAYALLVGLIGFVAVILLERLGNRGAE